MEGAVARIATEPSKEVDFSYLINPQVILPNGNDFELDLVFCVNDNFFWIEAKSGDYQQHITKYSRIATLLGLDYEHSIMVLTDIAPNQSDALTSLFGMTVYSLNQLEDGLKDTLVRDFQ